MTNDPVRVVFQLDRSPLLLGVLRCAVEFQSLQAGLHTDSCPEFAKACEDVCREAFSQFTDADGKLEVTLDKFDDRMEISILHHGQLVPAIGLETFALVGCARPAARPDSMAWNCCREWTVCCSTPKTAWLGPRW